MDVSNFEELDHTADYEIRIQGKDLADLFTRAGRAMYELMQVASESAAGPIRQIQISAHDAEELLVSWLEELLFILEVEALLLEVNSLEITGGVSLHAEVQALPAGFPAKEIKAVTYHGLAIRSIETGYSATIIFDV